MNIKKMTKTKEKWFIARTRYIPALWPIITYWTWDVNSFIGVKDTGKVFNIFDKGHFTATMEKDKLMRMEEKIFHKLLAEYSNLKKIREKGIKTGEEVISFCKNFSKKVKEASINEFIEFFDKLIKEYAKVERDNMFYWFLID